MSDHDLLIRISEQVDALRREVGDTRTRLDGALETQAKSLADCRMHMEARVRTLELHNAESKGSAKATAAIAGGIATAISIAVQAVVGFLH